MNSSTKNLPISANTNISFDAVLNGIATLETNQIVDFMHEIGKILARRNSESLPSREITLLKNIASAIPSKLQARRVLLSQKLNDETIYLEEHQELLKIIAKVEQKTAKKLEFMLELAQLRNVNLRTLAQQISPYAA